MTAPPSDATPCYSRSFHRMHGLGMFLCSRGFQHSWTLLNHFLMCVPQSYNARQPLPAPPMSTLLIGRKASPPPGYTLFV